MALTSTVVDSPARSRTPTALQIMDTDAESAACPCSVIGPTWRPSQTVLPYRLLNGDHCWSRCERLRPLPPTEVRSAAPRQRSPCGAAAHRRKTTATRRQHRRLDDLRVSSLLACIFATHSPLGTTSSGGPLGPRARPPNPLRRSLPPTIRTHQRRSPRSGDRGGHSQAMEPPVVVAFAYHHCSTRWENPCYPQCIATPSASSRPPSLVARGARGHSRPSPSPSFARTATPLRRMLVISWPASLSVEAVLSTPSSALLPSFFVGTRAHPRPPTRLDWLI